MVDGRWEDEPRGRGGDSAGGGPSRYRRLRSVPAALGFALHRLALGHEVRVGSAVVRPRSIGACLVGLGRDRGGTVGRRPCTPRCTRPGRRRGCGHRTRSASRGLYVWLDR